MKQMLHNLPLPMLPETPQKGTGEGEKKMERAPAIASVATFIWKYQWPWKKEE